MDIENRKELKSLAMQRLSACPAAGKIALVYGAVIVGASLISNGISLLLDSQIARTGGLQDLGLRAVLSSLQTMVPILMNVLMLCIGLGFTGAMLRVSRGQYVSLNSMKIGFDRFWVLLRATLLKAGLYVLAAIASYMLSMQIFFLTPLSKGLMSIMAPMVKGSGDMMAIVENPAFLEQMVSSMLPLYVLAAILFLVLAAPIYYRYILTNYLIIDNPGVGALLNMSMSKTLMRKKTMKFLKLDFSLWIYYVCSAIALFSLYTGAILGLLGIQLPFSPTVNAVLFFGLHLVLTFLVSVFLEPHKEVTHALAYNSLRPREQPSGGVVLGNIFDLAKDQDSL